MEKFEWQHINFIDGRNPYICKTKKEFKYIKERYILEPVKDNFWEAKYIVSYSVIGFSDKLRCATFNKKYKTRSEALYDIKKLVNENKFELIVLRKEEDYLKNNDSLCIEISTTIMTYEDGKCKWRKNS